VSFPVGCSTITWRRQASLEQMLREISEAGYAGSPAGFREDESPSTVRDLYASFGLRPAPGYLGANYHDASEHAAIFERARQHADWSAALGVTELFVAESCFAERFAVAGHQTANRDDQLPDAGYRAMADGLNEVGRICRERGVTACFHNHAGSYVETRDEFDRLLSLTDPALLKIGLDTGHLAYAGADVASFARAHAPRIKALHLKDVFPRVLADARQQRLGYHDAQARGLWAELGEGTVDFAAMFDALRGAGFDGWAIVEIDQTTRPTPRDSILACRDYLRGIGAMEAAR
jgi:inosose dehydratase